jgi:hypothetical protein
MLTGNASSIVFFLFWQAVAGCKTLLPLAGSGPKILPIQIRKQSHSRK